MQLDGKKIGFALTGSFCTFDKVIPQVEKLVSAGAEVFPILSEIVNSTDTRFGTAKELKDKLYKITGKDMIASIAEAEPIGPKKMLDLLVIAPCTGNTLGKIANGITDTSVTMACKAHIRNRRPVLLAISTNDGLAASAKNLGMVLNSKFIYVVPFGQDDPYKKPNSLVAKMDMILPAVSEVFEGRQLQPILV